MLVRDPLFVALTRPQTLGGVTYGFAVLNGIVATELFLVFKSLWVLLAAAIIHAAGYLASIDEPRIFDIWLARVSRCPRVRNYAQWRCNSYRP